MSKKQFLKRSYADVLKGNHGNKQELGEPGESQIKPKYLGFHYSEISAGVVSDNSSYRHGIKKRKTSPLNKSPKKPTSPIIISSEDDASPQKTCSLPTPTMGIDYIDIITPVKSETDTSEYELPLKKGARRAKKNLFKHFDYQRLPDFDFGSDEQSSDSSILPDELSRKVENISSPPKPSQNRENVISDQSLVETVDDEFKELYENDPLLPVFKRMDRGIRTADAVELLMRKLDENQLARNIPIEITKNVSFVYSINNIGHWKNALCDGMGKWEQMGKETTFVDVKSTEISIISSSKVNNTTLNVIRRKYKNGSCNSLHRILIMLENPNTGLTLDQMFVQYYFTGEEKKISIRPHGNTKKKISSTYQRTAETTRQRIMELCNLKKNPKDVYHSVLEEQGVLKMQDRDPAFHVTECRSVITSDQLMRLLNKIL